MGGRRGRSRRQIHDLLTLSNPLHIAVCAGVDETRPRGVPGGPGRRRVSSKVPATPAATPARGWDHRRLRNKVANDALRCDGLDETHRRFLLITWGGGSKSEEVNVAEE
eukprot:4551220-Pleurochrysis_carterae.AAC.2